MPGRSGTACSRGTDGSPAGQTPAAAAARLHRARRVPLIKPSLSRARALSLPGTCAQRVQAGVAGHRRQNRPARQGHHGPPSRLLTSARAASTWCGPHTETLAGQQEGGPGSPGRRRHGPARGPIPRPAGRFFPGPRADFSPARGPIKKPSPVRRPAGRGKPKDRSAGKWNSRPRRTHIMHDLIFA